MKAATRLLVLLTVCGSVLSAQGMPQSQLQGVWRVTEIVVTGAGAATVSAPQPGLFIFAKRHYSLMWVPGSAPRTLFKTESPTTEEKVAAFDSVLASSGTYEVSGPTVTLRPTVGRGPNLVFMSQQFVVEGDTLTLTSVSTDGHIRIGSDVVRSALPTSTTRLKLIRVE